MTGMKRDEKVLLVENNPLIAAAVSSAFEEDE